jgi:hypothetical protein
VDTESAERLVDRAWHHPPRVSKALPHNRLVAQAAKEVLSPLGLTQKGRSRVWLDDHAWWLGVVEFQPLELVSRDVSQRRRDVALAQGQGLRLLRSRSPHR